MRFEGQSQATKSQVHAARTSVSLFPHCTLENEQAPSSIIAGTSCCKLGEQQPYTKLFSSLHASKARSSADWGASNRENRASTGLNFPNTPRLALSTARRPHPLTLLFESQNARSCSHLHPHHLSHRHGDREHQGGLSSSRLALNPFADPLLSSQSSSKPRRPATTPSRILLSPSALFLAPLRPPAASPS
jgi:hypothetical protein